MANAFSTQGATTNGNSLSLTGMTKSLVNNTTPKAKALDSFKFGSAVTQDQVKPQSTNNRVLNATSTSLTPNQSMQTKPVAPVAPVTPKIALTTQGTVNSGTSYQPTVKGTSAGMIDTPKSDDKSDIKSDLSSLTPQVTQPQTPVDPTPTQPAPTQPTQPTTYPGMVQQNYNNAPKPTDEYTKYQNTATDAIAKAAGFENAVGQKLLDVTTNPEYSIDTGVGLGGRIAATQGLKMQELNKVAQGARDQASIANTQQGLQNTALNNATTLAQPILGQYGQANYGFGGNAQGGGVQPNEPFYKTLQNYAQLRSSGQESLIPSSISGNSVLNDQVTQMTKAINPSYNANIAGVQGQTQGHQYGQVQEMTSNLQQGQNLQSQLSDLISSTGINPNDVTAGNKLLQTIASNTSDPRYKALENLVTDIVSTYSKILTPGSNTDSSRATAASLLDASAKGESIIQTMHQLDTAAKAKIAGVQTIGNTQTNTQSSGVKNAPIIKTTVGDIDPNF